MSRAPQESTPADDAPAPRVRTPAQALGEELRRSRGSRSLRALASQMPTRGFSGKFSQYERGVLLPPLDLLRDWAKACGVDEAPLMALHEEASNAKRASSPKSNTTLIAGTEPRSLSDRAAASSLSEHVESRLRLWMRRPLKIAALTLVATLLVLLVQYRPDSRPEVIVTIPSGSQSVPYPSHLTAAVQGISEKQKLWYAVQGAGQETF